ncbi:MAG: hypothetical protein QF439_02730 [Candidatus Marinimicrobia bacterium]|jgi:hypothetical protein|nr:hypothetical protein [Candidatus Neomarinimicrobiota bacterium]|tara:strand:- start:1393 stop:2799 length:1407 start_codon:yes stop_codon:yes gene_type:complete
MEKRLIRLLCLGAFLFSGIYGQHIPMPDDLNNRSKLGYRKKTKNDLSDFMLFSPYYFNADSLKTNAMVGISPGFYFGGVKDEIIMVQAWGSASINNWSLLVEPVIVNEIQGQNALGTSFTRFGISGRIRNAFLRYSGHSSSLQIGRAPIFWGQSRSHSIVHTTSGPTYDHISAKINFKQFQFELFSGQLGPDTTNIVVRIKRLTAGHRLTWLSESNKLMISLGEQVIYTGKHRSFEFMYLNPFVPYFFTAVEGDELYQPDDSDNSIIFITARYNLQPTFSIYGEFVIDDLQVDRGSVVEDQIGLRLGAEGALSIAKYPVTWEVDFTTLNTWTNIHPGQSPSWYNRGHALGYLYGSDLWSDHIQVNAWLTKQILLNLDYTWLGKGSNTLQAKYDNWFFSIPSESFPSEPVINHHLITTSVSLWNSLGMFEIGYSTIPFANKIAYEGMNSSTEGGIYFRYQYILQKVFNI